MKLEGFYENIPIYSSSDCPKDTLYFYNEKAKGDLMNSINEQLFGGIKIKKLTFLDKLRWLVDDLRYKLAVFIAGDMF